MKSIMISIQPKWCAKIESGVKTIEVRKTRPKIETPFKCYIYESKGKTKYWSQPMPIPYREGGGKVIGEFVRDRIEEYRTEFYDEEEAYQEIRKVWLDEDYDYPVEDYRIITTNERENPSDCKLLKNACLTFDEIKKYVGYGDGKFCSLHISELKIYDKPKELGEFRKPCDADENCYLCEKSGFTPNMQIDCFNFLTRPPRSWSYVEETFR